MTTATATDTTTSAGAAALPVKLKRRSARHSTMPGTAAVTYSDDRKTAFVALQGRLADGKVAMVDTVTWLCLSERYGAAWSINWNGRRTRFYVCRAHQRVAAAARQSGSSPKASLARIIAGAAPGKAVAYRDGDPLNLRRANLEVISIAEQRRRCLEAGRKSNG